MRGFCTWDGRICNAGASQGQDRDRRNATVGARGPWRATRGPRAALGDVGDGVVGGMMTLAGHSGAGTGGSRPAGSGAPMPTNERGPGMRLSSGPEHSSLTNRPVIVTQSDSPSSSPLPLQQRGSPYSRVQARCGAQRRNVACNAVLGRPLL